LISKDILLTCQDAGESLESLRNWLILRKDYNGRSGMFTLKENISAIKGRGLKSLDNKSNVNKFNSARSELFYNSILFTPLKNELFKFKSEKQILIDYKGNCSTIKYKIPESHLNNKKLFLDFCIGMYSDKKNYSNKRIAAAFKITERRVQLATHRNDAAGLFIKTQRKVLEFFPNRSEALKTASNLRQMNIYSSKPFQFGKDIAISLNTSNKITSNVLRRIKGKSQTAAGHTQRTDKVIKKMFIPVFKGKGSGDIRRIWENTLNAKIMMFNESVYNLGDFICQHGDSQYA